MEIIILAVVLVILGIGVYPIVRKFKKARELAKSFQPQKTVEESPGLLSRIFGQERKANPNPFSEGQRLRFQSENDGNGPLIWGVVIRERFRGKRCLLLGDDGRKYRRKWSILTWINFPEKLVPSLPVPDCISSEELVRLEKVLMPTAEAAGYGAVNPPEPELEPGNVLVAKS